MGKFSELQDLSVENVERSMQRVLGDPRYRERARWFQKAIARTRGLDVAATAIERAFGMRGSRVPAERHARLEDADSRP